MLTDVALHTSFYTGDDSDDSECNLANDSGRAYCTPFPSCDLRNIHLSVTAPDWRDISPHKNLQLLTLIVVSEANASELPDFLRYLAASPVLESLILRDFTFDFSLRNPIPDHEGPVVELPLLHRLAISRLRPQDGQVLFPHLRIPNVEIMDLDCDGLFGTS